MFSSTHDSTFKLFQQLETATERSPITVFLGLCQCGKTTLSRQIAELHGAHFFDLESPADQQRLQNPQLMFAQLQGLIILSRWINYGSCTRANTPGRFPRSLQCVRFTTSPLLNMLVRHNK